jgi:trans-aconitate methyltransferase
VTQNEFWQDFWIEKGASDTAAQKTGRANFNIEAWVLSFGDALKLVNAEQDNNILDFGCGPGYFTYLLSMKASSITGYDIAANMIQSAQKDFGCKKNIYFTSNFEDVCSNKYDKILCYSSLQYVPKHQIVHLLNSLLSLIPESGEIIIASVPHNQFEYTKFLKQRNDSSSELELSLINKLNWFSKSFLLKVFAGQPVKITEIDMPEKIWNSFYMKNYIIKKT